MSIYAGYWNPPSIHIETENAVVLAYKLDDDSAKREAIFIQCKVPILAGDWRAIGVHDKDLSCMQANIAKAVDKIVNEYIERGKKRVRKTTKRKASK